MTEPAHFDRAEATEAIRRIVLSYPEASDTGDLPGVGRFMDGVRLGHFGLSDEEMASRLGRRGRRDVRTLRRLLPGRALVMQST